jgi:hypothetical protein
LPSGYQESGTWSANVSAVTGAPQVQVTAAITFPVRLKKGAVVKAVYRNVKEDEAPMVPCAGSPTEPFVSAGTLCVYRGFAFKGGLETQDRNMAFFTLVEPNGENSATEGRAGNLGEGVVFRSVNNTPEFKELSPVESEAAYGTITEAAYLSAFGSWAVTEK